MDNRDVLNIFTILQCKKDPLSLVGQHVLHLAQHL